LVPRHEYCGYGVGRDWCGVFNVPVGSIASPEKCDAAFASTGGAGCENVVTEL